MAPGSNRTICQDRSECLDSLKQITLHDIVVTTIMFMSPSDDPFSNSTREQRVFALPQVVLVDIQPLDDLHPGAPQLAEILQDQVVSFHKL